MVKKDKTVKSKANALVKIVLEKQAVKPIVMDIRGMSSLCDFFVICSGETGRQVQAIYQNILDRAPQENLTVHHSEADEGFSWVLVDLFDIVVHIFTNEARAYYNLEYLWRDAKTVASSRAGRKKSAKSGRRKKVAVKSHVHRHR